MTKANTPTRNELRDSLVTMLRENGKSEAEIATYVARVEADWDLNDRIEGAGLIVSYRTCHYEWQVTVAGNTYGVRNELKGMGYKWDKGERMWVRKMTESGKSIANHMDTAREEIDGMLAKMN